MKTKNRFNGLLARAPLASAVAIALLVAPAAQAFEFENGELVGSWDTTASFGISQRSNDPAVDLIGKATINPLIATAGQSIPGVPTLGTFPGSAERMLDVLLAQVRAEGAACLLVTHSSAAAARADRVLRLLPQGIEA